MTTTKISGVIICLNAADTIGRAIASLEGLTSDIVVSDTGSTDGTLQIIAAATVRGIHYNWEGYGANKNLAARHALNEWILSLDADEYLEPGFAQFAATLNLTDNHKVYQFKRLNFLGAKAIRFGEWGNDKVVRLYNRGFTQWDPSPVHEELEINNRQTILVKTRAAICHRTAPDIQTYRRKLQKYAALMANKYFSRNRKVGILKLYVSPLSNFIHNYLLRMGFLDGKEGWQIAAAHAGYTFNKYRMLMELHRHAKDGTKDNLLT
jgi:glycosyltransferase involved in cell wall biosynthesis